MKTCPNCNLNYADGNAFCEKCGTALVDVVESAPVQPEPQPVQQPAQQPVQQPAQQPVQQSAPQPVQQPTPQPVPQYNYQATMPPYMYSQINENMLPERYQPVSIGQYIGYSILFNLPIIGFIMLLVTAFSSGGKESLKNFAKSYLVLYLIGIILLILMVVLVSVLGISMNEMYYY